MLLLNVNNKKANNKHSDHFYLIWLKKLWLDLLLFWKKKEGKINITFALSYHSKYEVNSTKENSERTFKWQHTFCLPDAYGSYSCNLILIVYSCLQIMLHFTGWSKLGSNARLQEPKVQQFNPQPQCIYSKFMTRWRYLFKRRKTQGLHSFFKFWPDMIFSWKKFRCW